MTNIDNIAEHTEKKPKSVSLVLGAQAFAFVASFVITSLREYGGFNYFEYSTLVQDVIAQSIGAVFFFPIIHMGIASIWESKRNKLTRRNIFFGWAVAVGLLQLAGLFMLKSS